MKAFCLFYHNDGLLPYWLRHYCRQQPHLIVPEDIDEAELAPAREDSRCVVHRFSGTYVGGCIDTERTLEVVRRVVEPGEWYIVADLDEFHLLTPPSEHDSAVLARFVDRISLDGKLNEIDQTRTLDEQFPLCFNPSMIVPPMGTMKVAMVRAPAEFTAGHHMCTVNAYAEDVGETHHFKWHGAKLLAWLQHRANLTHYDPSFESRAFLDHIARFGGVNVQDYSLYVRKARSIGV